MPEFITKIQNVKGEIVEAKVNNWGYWSYKMIVHNPSKDIKQYLYNEKSIYINGSKEQEMAEKETKTIIEMGIEAYSKKDKTTGYRGHIIRDIEPQPSIKTAFEEEIQKNKELKESKTETIKELSEEIKEQNLWEIYFQRLEQILSLFKEKGIITDAALAGAILGLRELMLR